MIYLIIFDLLPTFQFFPPGSSTLADAEHRAVVAKREFEIAQAELDLERKKAELEKFKSPPRPPRRQRPLPETAFEFERDVKSSVDFKNVYNKLKKRAWNRPAESLEGYIDDFLSIANSASLPDVLTIVMIIDHLAAENIEVRQYLAPIGNVTELKTKLLENEKRLFPFSNSSRRPRTQELRCFNCGSKNNYKMVELN